MRNRPAKSRFCAAILGIALSANILPAQLPENITRGVARPPASVEVYTGTQKVEPVRIDPQPTVNAISSIAARVGDASHSALSSTGQFFTRLVERNTPKWDTFRVPVVVNITVPPTVVQQVPVRTDGMIQQASFAGATTSASAPGYLPWVNTSRDLTPSPREESKPTVIVVREAAAVAAPVEPGIVVSPAMLALTFAGFLFALSMLLLVVVLFRTRQANARFDPFAKARQPGSVREGHLAVAGWDAGPMPETAQKFDIGPSYAEQLVQQKVAEVDNENAMLQHILQQNLALQAALHAE